MPNPLVAPALISAGSNILGSLLGGGGQSQSAVHFGDLGRLMNIYSSVFGRFNPLLSQLGGRSQQSTYLSPEQYSTLFRQLTSPGLANINESFGQQSRGLASSFANRGQLFGGSLTGAQAQLGVGQQRAVSDLFSNVGGQLGTMDVQLGAQRQGQSEALIGQLLQAILSGGLNLGQLARRG